MKSTIIDENKNSSFMVSIMECVSKYAISFVIINKISQSNTCFIKAEYTHYYFFSKLELDLIVYSATSCAKDEDLSSNNLDGELYSSVRPA